MQVHVSAWAWVDYAKDEVECCRIYRKSGVEAGQIGEVVQNGGLLSALKYPTAILFVVHVEKFAI